MGIISNSVFCSGLVISLLSVYDSIIFNSQNSKTWLHNNIFKLSSKFKKNTLLRSPISYHPQKKKVIMWINFSGYKVRCLVVLRLLRASILSENKTHGRGERRWVGKRGEKGGVTVLCRRGGEPINHQGKSHTHYHPLSMLSLPNAPIWKIMLLFPFKMSVL